MRGWRSVLVGTIGMRHSTLRTGLLRVTLQLPVTTLIAPGDGSSTRTRTAGKLNEDLTSAVQSRG